MALLSRTALTVIEGQAPSCPVNRKLEHAVQFKGRSVALHAPLLCCGHMVHLKDYKASDIPFTGIKTIQALFSTMRTLRLGLCVAFFTLLQLSICTVEFAELSPNLEPHHYAEFHGSAIPRRSLLQGFSDRYLLARSPKPQSGCLSCEGVNGTPGCVDAGVDCCPNGSEYKVTDAVNFPVLATNSYEQ
ncbi:hypothetical protein TWF281_001316 [Arthrobotrys megalospora]